MKYLFLITAMIIASCSTEELVKQSRAECDTIGYAPGTIEHTQCVERGTRDRLQDGEEVADAVAWAIILEAF